MFGGSLYFLTKSASQQRVAKLKDDAVEEFNSGLSSLSTTVPKGQISDDINIHLNSADNKKLKKFAEKNADIPYFFDPRNNPANTYDGEVLQAFGILERVGRKLENSYPPQQIKQKKALFNCSYI